MARNKLQQAKADKQLAKAGWKQKGDDQNLLMVKWMNKLYMR